MQNMTNHRKNTEVTISRLVEYRALMLRYSKKVTRNMKRETHRKSIIIPTTWIPIKVIAPSNRMKCRHLDQRMGLKYPIQSQSFIPLAKDSTLLNMQKLLGRTSFVHTGDR